MQVPVRALEQPVMDHARLVSGRVVEHEADVEVSGHHGLNLVEERPEPGRAVTARAGIDHRARPHVERCEQVGGAMADVVAAASSELAQAHRQDGPRCPRWLGSGASRPHTALGSGQAG